MKQIDAEKELRRKAARKARPGGGVKWRNIPRNWAHQAVTYMDAGELSFRFLVQVIETIIIWVLLVILFSEIAWISTLFMAFLLVHTWNWMTNGLFWAVIIFTFPGLKNPGPQKTVAYLNDMRDRLSRSKCMSGIAIYGSVTRQAWHDRSDIDIRFLRHKGAWNLICAGFHTMEERFRAFLARQPMDLFLADDVDFLMKMRSEEIPILTLCRDDRLQVLYPDCSERDVSINDLLGNGSAI